MKKSARKILIIFICAILILPLLPLTRVEAVDNDIYYCREALKSLPDADKLIFAYDKLTEGIENSTEEIKIHNGTDSISVDELGIVFEAYRRDHTEHFWLGNSYSYTTFAGSVINVYPEYSMSGATLENAKLQFESAVEGILSQLTDEMSEYEKEKKIHDLLAARVSYVESGNAHNAYGALVEGLAVCEGYAEAFQYLLHRVGIQSLLVYGSSENPSTGESEPHAWNMVKIDGQYYHTDLTWNDQESHLYYAYFNQTDEIITKDHIIDPSPFPVPSCTATENCYFTIDGTTLSSYTVESVAQLLLDNNLVLRAFVPEDRDAFISWITSNIQSIAQEMDIHSAFGYSYSSIGCEVILIIDTCQHNDLTFVPTVNATCTQNGMNQHYLCSCGKIFSDSTGKNEIIDTSTLILVAGHMWTEKIENADRVKSVPTSCAEYYSYYYTCEDCGSVSTDKFFVSDTTLPHNPVLVEGVAPTCSDAGKAPYYQCSCGKCFADANATNAITNINAYGRLDRTSHGEMGILGNCPDCGEFVELTSSLTTFSLVLGVALIVVPAILVRFVSPKNKKSSYKKSKKNKKIKDEALIEEFDEGINQNLYSKISLDDLKNNK